LPPSRPLNQLGQLSDVFLGGVTFVRDFDFDVEVDGPGLEYHITAETQAHETERHDKDVWLAELTASVLWTHRKKDTFVAPFQLEVKVIGVFDWLGEGYADDAISDWIRYNAEHLLWPYLRAYIQQITAASDIPPLTIFTIGVPRPRVGQPADDTDASRKVPRGG
jgi:preprotein translocase subunit SecB